MDVYISLKAFKKRNSDIEANLPVLAVRIINKDMNLFLVKTFHLFHLYDMTSLSVPP